MIELVRDNRIAQHIGMIAKAHYLGFVAQYDDTISNVNVTNDGQVAFEISSAKAKAPVARIHALPLYHKHPGTQSPTDVVMLMYVLDLGLSYSKWWDEFVMISMRARSFVIKRNEALANRDKEEAEAVWQLDLRLVTHAITSPREAE